MAKLETKASDELLKAAEPLIAQARAEFGETEYIYYALPISYCGKGRNKSFYTPITGLERYVITREEFEQNEAQGRQDTRDAFMGKRKTSYTKYERRVNKKGWRENLIDLLKSESI